MLLLILLLLFVFLCLKQFLFELKKNLSSLTNLFFIQDNNFQNRVQQQRVSGRFAQRRRNSEEEGRRRSRHVVIVHQSASSCHGGREGAGQAAEEAHSHC